MCKNGTKFDLYKKFLSKSVKNLHISPKTIPDLLLDLVWFIRAAAKETKNWKKLVFVQVEVRQNPKPSNHFDSY